MARRFMSVGIAVAVCIGALSVAAPAMAQVGGLFGKVVNEKGEPVADAEIILENTEAMMKMSGVKTNAKGEWSRAGVRAGQGRWSVEARKDGLSAGIRDVTARTGAQTEVPDIVLRAAPKAAIGSISVDKNLSAEAAAARAKLIATIQKLFNDATAAAEAKNYDVAIASLSEATTKMPECGLCYLKLGEVQVSKNDPAAAEKAYLKVIEIDEKSKEAGEAYAALAGVYNKQRRYDEAAKASEKSAALLGGGDATSVFNAGVILVNANKFPEAKVQFERAIKLDPKMADAHYWLGIAFVSEGKMTEGKASLAEYLKLAPTGQYADTAKEIMK
jgi:tetratricopeptide (TPR) repeat protein